MNIDQETCSIIKKDCSKPIYMQVAEYLSDNINSGRWKDSERIPSEAELTESLGVSRGSVKKAISKLVDEGVLEQIQGKGTYVKPHDISFPLAEGLISFSESLAEQGIEFETRIIEIEERDADAELAAHLNIPVGSPYLHLERVRQVHGEPIMYIENNINSSLAKGILDADFVNDSLFSIIEHFTGRQVAYSKTSFVANAADAKRSEYLKVKAESPLLQQIQTVHLDDDRVIEYARVWLKSSRFYLGTIFQRRR